jgi:hypothetical protein
MEMYDATIRAGLPDPRGGVSIAARELAQHIYTPQQISTIENNIIGWAMSQDANYDYADVLSTTGRFAAKSAPVEDFGYVRDSAVNVLASIAAENAGKYPPSPALPIPPVWPNWIEIGSIPIPGHLTDEFDPPGVVRPGGIGPAPPPDTFAPGGPQSPQAVPSNVWETIRDGAAGARDWIMSWFW